MGYTKKTSAIPAMTSNTTPSGKSSVSSFSDNYTNYAFRAFDKTTNYWLAQSKSGWVKYEFDLPLVISKYLLQATIIINGAPSQWTFEGSNDDINWTILDTKTGINDWTSGMTKEFDIQNRVKYKFYRLNIATTKDGSERIYLAELDMFEYVFYDKFLLSTGDSFISYSPSVISDTTLIPKMTSNNTPSGVVEASNSWGANFLPYKAFNGFGGGGGIWLAAVAALPVWISYEFSNLTEVTSYAIKSSNTSRQPKKWTFEGYINGRWIVLDKRDNVTDWVNGTKKVFTISESKSCKKYRLNIELVNGDPTYLEVDEIEMYGIFDYGRIKYLPSASEDDFISRGLDKSTQINLEETLKYKEYVASESTVLGSGKVYARLVDPNKTPIKSIIIS